uniref:Thioredoxin domain-containing protein n=1 Tax=Kalanchoe fedtschenkoi TaxID=63787 RepID=A0A7N1A8Y1_KALFE
MSKSTPPKIGPGGGGGGGGSGGGRGGGSSFSDRLQEAVSLDDERINKPDFRELDLGSPVSPLHTRPSGLAAGTATTTTSSSSSSSESAPGRVASILSTRRDTSSHSGELSGSSESSPNAAHTRNTSKPATAHDHVHRSTESTQCGGGSVNSPPAPAAVLPAGNICPSGRIYKTGMHTNPNAPRRDVLRTGTGHYGHGSIMRGPGAAAGGNAGLQTSGFQPGNVDFGLKRGMASRDPEEVKMIANEMHKRGNFVDALKLYDRTISLSPGNASYRCNRAAALSGLGRLGEAVRECEEALKLDPGYSRAHQRLGSLFIRLGMVDVARKHLCFPGQQPDAVELQKLQDVERHLKKCTDARKACDWKRALRECDAAVAAGADSSPQLCAFRAEALLKLHRLEDAELSLSASPRSDSCTISISHTKFFGMLSEAYVLYVRAQIEMSLGRFDNAVSNAEKAGLIDPRNIEVAQLINNVKLVTRARNRGNDLFKSDRFTEACSAYGEGLRLDPSNSILYCNRAACWVKIGQWERSIEDCNQALRIQPSYTKALLRRAVSNTKLERWSDAVGDYEALRKALPDDNEVAKSLFHAQVALRKSRGEEVHNMKFGGEVEEVSGLQHFKAAISSPGVSIAFFKANANQECADISPYVDKLCRRYPLVSFIKVDIEESPAVADVESVRIVPTFKIFKSGSQLKEMICPTHQVLECTVRHYNSS